MEQNPLPEKRKKGDKHRNQNRNQETEHHFLRKKRTKKNGDKHRHQSRNHQEQGNHGGTERHSGEKRKEKEGKQAPEPEPEPKGTNTS